MRSPLALLIRWFVHQAAAQNLVRAVAVQWWRNGDHPGDNLGELMGNPFDDELHPRQEGAVVRYFTHPDFHADQLCPHCAYALGDHGWIDQGAEGRTVCPGDWIITVDGQHHPVKPGAYAALTGRSELRKVPE